jgi:DNA-binding MarR family transcriptional regulator
MVDQIKSKRQQELNAALEAIYFGFRGITAKPDQRLASLDLSRVHHRILYFIARNAGCSINELLATMGVTKQYLHRPLQRLIEDKYILVKPDPTDKRIKRLQLSKKGTGLENELSGDQRQRFQQVFNEAGPQAEAGWRKVMELLGSSGEEL